jgi:S1 RNA binding domain protein
MAIEVGTKLEGKVTGITHFGAFIELPEGVTGLVHISEIAENYVKDVKEHLKLDDKVMVKVIHVDKDGKIGLSIKQTIEKPLEDQSTSTVKPNSPGRRNFSSKPGGDQQGPRYPSSGGDRSHARGNNSRNAKAIPTKLTFEDKVSRFLKDSEERISSLKKNTESKRGGRGGRRD